MNKEKLRTLVRGAYDVQELRIMEGNRLVENFKAKLGHKPSEKEDKLDKEGKEILAKVRASYKKITDGVARMTRKRFKADGIISDFTDLSIVENYLSMEELENAHFKRVKTALADVPLYTEYLEKIKGIGPSLGGFIVSEIDITACEYPSSLWAYAGLDVASDGRGRTCKKEHLIDREYKTADGEIKIKKSITYNPRVRSKLIGVMAPSFIRARDNKYSEIYYNYRKRIDNMEIHQAKTKLHRQRMANRYMIKRFLVDLYVYWRKLEGLPVATEYSEGKLGIVHKRQYSHSVQGNQSDLASHTDEGNHRRLASQ